MQVLAILISHQSYIQRQQPFETASSVRLSHPGVFALPELCPMPVTVTVTVTVTGSVAVSVAVTVCERVPLARLGRRGLRFCRGVRF